MDEQREVCAFTATADDDSFDTKDVSGGAKSKAVKFATVGEFKYHCIHDSAMKGIVVVKEARKLSSTEVVMNDNTFSPTSITIQVGDSIVWMNKGKYAHTATADDGSFDTKDVSSGAKSKAVKFATAGEFKYHCIHDSAMKGTVVVK